MRQEKTIETAVVRRVVLTSGIISYGVTVVRSIRRPRGQNTGKFSNVQRIVHVVAVDTIRPSTKGLKQ